MDSQVALAVLCKGRFSSWQMNRILRRVGATTAAAGFLPSWGYFMSMWNPSDKGSRKFEKQKGVERATPRRTRPKKKTKLNMARAAAKRRNRTFTKDFDSTLGCPGEGPQLAKARRIGRPRVKVIPTQKKRKLETVVGRRTSAERRAARKGISLRQGMISDRTRSLYASAFLHLWAWAQTCPPDDLSSMPGSGA